MALNIHKTVSGGASANSETTFRALSKRPSDETAVPILPLGENPGTVIGNRSWAEAFADRAERADYISDRAYPPEARSDLDLDSSSRSESAAIVAQIRRTKEPPSGLPDDPGMEPMKPMSPMKPMEPMKPMQPMKAPERWWPEELGENPNSAGGQNEARYAFFGDKKRLAVDLGDGKVQVYDTADHRISGVQQDQSGSGRNVTFTTQHGEVELKTLKRV